MESSNKRWLAKTCRLLVTKTWPEHVPLSFDGSWFHDTKRNEACVSFCHAVCTWGKATKLTIKNISVNADSREALEEALAANPLLKKLTLHGITSQDGRVEFLSRSFFSSNKKVEELTIDKCTLRSQDYQMLQRILNADSLRVLRLLRVSLDDAMPRISTGLELSSSMETLDLSGTNMSSKTFCSLLTCLAGNEKLESLIMKDCGVGAFNETTINEFLLTNKHLRILDLSNNDIWGDSIGVWAKEGLLKNSSLRRLHLSQNPIGDDGAVHLTQLLRTNSSIESISLIDCEIWGNGCHCLAEGLAFMPGLKHLFVDGEMEDHAGTILESLQRNMTLTHLWTDRSAYLIHKDRQWRLVEFYLRLNRGKRKLLIEPKTPASLWPLALESIAGDPRLMYYMIRQKPEILAR